MVRQDFEKLSIYWKKEMMYVVYLCVLYIVCIGVSNKYIMEQFLRY